jgi:hypothetical protein
MNELREFFEAERKRVVSPGPFFTQRVMARLRDRSVQDFGIWDVVPGSTRPVIAVALMLILCVAAVHMFVPQLPQRGMVESFLEPEQNPAESFLYNEADLPTRQDVLAQLIEPEDEQ